MIPELFLSPMSPRNQELGAPLNSLLKACTWFSNSLDDASESNESLSRSSSGGSRRDAHCSLNLTCLLCIPKQRWNHNPEVVTMLKLLRLNQDTSLLSICLFRKSTKLRSSIGASSRKNMIRTSALPAYSPPCDRSKPLGNLDW